MFHQCFCVSLCPKKLWSGHIFRPININRSFMQCLFCFCFCFLYFLISQMYQLALFIYFIFMGSWIYLETNNRKLKGQQQPWIFDILMKLRPRLQAFIPVHICPWCTIVFLSTQMNSQVNFPGLKVHWSPSFFSIISLSYSQRKQKFYALLFILIQQK